LIQLTIVTSVQLLNRNRRLALVKPYGQLWAIGQFFVDLI
jgi:hypothetical protein